LLRDSLLTGTPIWERPQDVSVVCLLCLLFMVGGMIGLKRAERIIFERHMA
jgi:hypothetical protein